MIFNNFAYIIYHLYMVIKKVAELVRILKTVFFKDILVICFSPKLKYSTHTESGTDHKEVSQHLKQLKKKKKTIQTCHYFLEQNAP